MGLFVSPKEEDEEKAVIRFGVHLSGW